MKCIGITHAPLSHVDFKRLLSTIIDVATAAFDSSPYHRFLVDQVLSSSVALLTLLDLEHILNGGRELLDKIFQIEVSINDELSVIMIRNSYNIFDIRIQTQSSAFR